ncbi:hypothetical protein RJT34_30328 [Clitoria ternatea]|uniref:Pectin acetylesterase n=1 Tax=Clitoria ternatea TaxID=43366 RepID=A0AAN9I0A3_CLITE
MNSSKLLHRAAIVPPAFSTAIFTGAAPDSSPEWHHALHRRSTAMSTVAAPPLRASSSQHDFFLRLGSLGNNNGEQLMEDGSQIAPGRKKKLILDGDLERQIKDLYEKKGRVQGFNEEEEALIKVLYEQFKDHRRCSYMIADALDIDCKFSLPQVSLKQSVAPKKSSGGKMDNKEVLPTLPYIPLHNCGFNLGLYSNFFVDSWEAGLLSLSVYFMLSTEPERREKKVDFSGLKCLMDFKANTGGNLAFVEGDFVPITIVEKAVSKGAVCLDGSPPAYHFDKGFGEGTKNWIVHIEACPFQQIGTNMKGSPLGSSKHMNEPLAFSGILNNNQQLNPDFYNWNRVKVRYCDGSSFTGDVEDVDQKTNLHFRGARIFAAVMEELLAKGLDNAENAILSGCSAGGLTTILHCDRFKTLLPTVARVKCVPDAGFFIHIKDISGTERIQEYYSQVVSTHGSTKNLPTSCTSKLSPELCFFPEHVAPHISTPIFFVNSPYDTWQIRNILAPGEADPHGLWQSCKLDINKCSPDQLSIMQDFRTKFLKALNVEGSSRSKGAFIDSCYAHCQTENQETWFNSESPQLANTTIAKAVGEWFYDRSPFNHIDCTYPCNPTCRNRVLDLKDHPGI